MKVIIAVDGSSCSMSAIDFVLDRLWSPEDEFIVLSVVEILPHDVGVGHIYAAQLEQDNKTTALKELTRDCKQKLLKEFPNNKVQAKIAYGLVVDQVCEIAREEKVDLIILGSHGRTGFDHFFIGSVAEAILKKAHCSVQIVKGDVPEHHFKDEEKSEAKTEK